MEEEELVKGESPYPDALTVRTHALPDAVICVLKFPTVNNVYKRLPNLQSLIKIPFTDELRRSTLLWTL